MIHNIITVYLCYFDINFFVKIDIKTMSLIISLQSSINKIMSYNKNIIDLFGKLIKQMEAEYLNAEVEGDMKEANSHKFRINQTKKVLKIIKTLDFDIKHVDDVDGIPGIGAGSKKRIAEILDRNDLSELKNKYTEDKQNVINSIQELEGIIGVGDKLAKKFVTEYKIRSIPELKKAIKKGDIEVNDKIKLGLKYYGVVDNVIPRKEITQTEKYLKKIIKGIDKNIELTICGSYRRGKSTSGDIDVLIVHPDLDTLSKAKNPTKYDLPDYLKLFVEKLTKEQFILDHMTDKNYITKYMGFSKFGDNPVRRIDIRLIAYDSLPTALLYYTGPYELNTYMREEAIKRNMKLNEYGLYKILTDGKEKMIKITSEEDVFEKLGMDYLDPIEREQFSSGNKR